MRIVWSIEIANYVCSASLGRVMRQYPLARLGVIAYIVCRREEVGNRDERFMLTLRQALIHLMGFYILASWNPEMHVDGLEDKPPPG